jgi:amicyanin
MSRASILWRSLIHRWRSSASKFQKGKIKYFQKECLRKMKNALFSVTAVAMLVLSFGVSKTSQAKPAASEQNSSREQYQVKIDNFSFGPATLTVPAGTPVTWINQDDVPHNVVSSEGKTLKSPVLDTDQKFSYTFTTAGTYPYYCGLHPKMTGKVVVQ